MNKTQPRNWVSHLARYKHASYVECVMPNNACRQTLEEIANT
jgi:hypothetical protein